jgi:hypothetical protein
MKKVKGVTPIFSPFLAFSLPVVKGVTPIFSPFLAFSLPGNDGNPV